MFSQEREGRRKRGPSPRHLHLLLLNQVFALVVFLSLYESLAFTPTDSRSHSGPSFPTRKGTTASCEQYLFGSPNIFTQENRHPKPAFLIERIGYAPNERIFRSIAELCINVFFKESLNAKPEDRIA